MKKNTNYQSIIKDPLEQDVPYLYYRELDLTSSSSIGTLAFLVPTGYLAYLQFISAVVLNNSPKLLIKIGRESSVREYCPEYVNISAIGQQGFENSQIFNFFPINQRLLHKETFFINYKTSSIERVMKYRIIAHTYHIKRAVP